MSKAFTKEDVDPPERSGRVRTASGLPPGATNYITPAGASKLQRELDHLCRVDQSRDSQRISELKQILESMTVIEPSEDSTRSVGFGARVRVCEADSNREKTYRILGVDELDLDPDAVSWISAIGRILLGAKLGDRITLPEIGQAKLIKVEYPSK